MKNYAPYIIYLESEKTYELSSPKPGIDFEDVFFPYPKRIPKKIYDEIDQIKRQKIRRLPHPFKDNTQKIC
jgi:hypothetical protein